MLGTIMSSRKPVGWTRSLALARIGKGLLPNDGFKSGPFDQLLHLYLGDPHAQFGGQGRQSETMDLQGGRDWNKLFLHLLTHCLHIRLYDAVYVLVDMPDLTKVDTNREEN